jgi:hypothetical protein
VAAAATRIEVSVVAHVTQVLQDRGAPFEHGIEIGDRIELSFSYNTATARPLYAVGILTFLDPEPLDINGRMSVGGVPYLIPSHANSGVTVSVFAGYPHDRFAVQLFEVTLPLDAPIPGARARVNFWGHFGPGTFSAGELPSDLSGIFSPGLELILQSRLTTEEQVIRSSQIDSVNWSIAEPSLGLLTGAGLMLIGLRASLGDRSIRLH